MTEDGETPEDLSDESDRVRAHDAEGYPSPAGISGKDFLAKYPGLAAGISGKDFLTKYPGLAAGISGKDLLTKYPGLAAGAKIAAGPGAFAHPFLDRASVAQATPSVAGLADQMARGLVDQSDRVRSPRIVSVEDLNRPGKSGVVGHPAACHMSKLARRGFQTMNES